MIELESPESYYRTEKNVIESDGTLILNKGNLSEGTKLTHDFTIKYGKPALVVQLDGENVVKPEHVIRWLNGQFISILNIAGPRESKCTACIYTEARTYLDNVLSLMKEYTES